MSDSRFLDAVGFSDLYDVTDEGGWQHEVLPVEDIGFAMGARVETELDLLPPAERELRELAWLDLGFEAFRELEDGLAGSGARAARAARAAQGGAAAEEGSGSETELEVDEGEEEGEEEEEEEGGGGGWGQASGQSAERSH
jgi:hypothetical protein